jgi:glycosyltransferase involved in cell wall biosynthesis
MTKRSPSNQIIVVTPVFEDSRASGILFKELAKQFDRAITIVAIDDCSTIQPLKISVLDTAGIDGIIIRLKRNVGHQRAISVGLSFISEYISEIHTIVVMDSDGEDAPESILKLMSGLEDKDTDIVVAQRARRFETLRFKVFYTFYKFLFRLMTGRTLNFGNFMAMKPSSLRRLIVMQELTLHIAGAVVASKLRAKSCLLDRGKRYAGKSRMNFVGLVLHGFRGLMVFAEDVLVRVGIACAITAALTAIAAIAAVALKIFGIATPGWFSVAIGILFLTFLQTIALSIMALMTLMLTGVARGGNTTPLLENMALIEGVTKTHGNQLLQEAGPESRIFL